MSDACQHFWVRDRGKWICSKCVEPMPGNPGTRIALKALEEMVDSSLRLADQILTDDQSVRGELWWMRQAMWLYRPYIFQLVYHVEKDKPEVLLFSHMMEPPVIDNWHSIIDTDSYRKLLRKADQWRREQS